MFRKQNQPSSVPICGFPRKLFSFSCFIHVLCLLPIQLPSGNDMKLRRQDAIWWESPPLDWTEPCNAGELSAEPWKRKTPCRIHLSHCCYQNNPKVSLHGTTGKLPNPRSPRTCNCSDTSWLLVVHQNTLYPSAIQHNYAEIHSPFKKCIQREKNHFPTNKQERIMGYIPSFSYDDQQ